MHCTAVVGSRNSESDERSFGHVHQQAEPVRQVLVEGALQPGAQRVGDRSPVEARGVAFDAHERSPGRHEAAETRHDVQHAVRDGRQLHQPLRGRCRPAHPSAVPRSRQEASRLVTTRSGQDRSSRSRMSVPTSSISADTRSDRPMWCTYSTSIAMLVNTNT